MQDDAGEILEESGVDNLGDQQVMEESDCSQISSQPVHIGNYQVILLTTILIRQLCCCLHCLASDIAFIGFQWKWVT